MATLYLSFTWKTYTYLFTYLTVSIRSLRLKPAFMLCSYYVLEPIYFRSLYHHRSRVDEELYLSPNLAQWVTPLTFQSSALSVSIM